VKAVKSTARLCVSSIHGGTADQNVRFLADRFVEGICPHCGADVLPPLLYPV
jgi:methionyl-tRNA synthetase